LRGGALVPDAAISIGLYNEIASLAFAMTPEFKISLYNKAINLSEVFYIIALLSRIIIRFEAIVPRGTIYLIQLKLQLMKNF